MSILVLTGSAGLAVLATAGLLGREMWRMYFGPAADRGPHRESRGPAGAVLPVVTSDGIELEAWWLEGKGRGVVVIAPGYRTPASAVSGLARGLGRRGFSVAWFTWRGCRPDTLNLQTVGVHERRDLQAVIAAARQRSSAMRIGLAGVSIGATLCLMEAADDLDVVAVWADSPITSPVHVTADAVRRRLHVSGWPLSWGVALCVRLRRGVSVWTIRAHPAITRLEAQVMLFVLSGADGLVPESRTTRILRSFELASRTWVVSGASHGAAWFCKPHEYVDRADAFFAERFAAERFLEPDAVRRRLVQVDADTALGQVAAS